MINGESQVIFHCSIQLVNVFHILNKLDNTSCLITEFKARGCNSDFKGKFHKSQNKRGKRNFKIGLDKVSCPQKGRL